MILILIIIILAKKVIFYMLGVRDLNMLFVLDVQNGERTLFNGQEPQEYKV